MSLYSYADCPVQFIHFVHGFIFCSNISCACPVLFLSLEFNTFISNPAQKQNIQRAGFVTSPHDQHPNKIAHETAATVTAQYLKKKILNYLSGKVIRFVIDGFSWTLYNCRKRVILFSYRIFFNSSYR